MNLTILFTLFASLSCMSQTIWFGDSVKVLKPNLILKDSDVKIITNDNDDPTVTAKNAARGSLYIRKSTGAFYQKQDDGSSTNWALLLIGGGPASFGNLSLSGNTIASTNTDGNIILNPNGTGQVTLPDLTASRPLKLTASNEITATQIDMASANDVTGVLDETNGGTGQSTITTGDILYGSAANTLSKLPAASNGDYLTQTAGVPAWTYKLDGGGINLLSNFSFEKSFNGTCSHANQTCQQSSTVTYHQDFVGEVSASVASTYDYRLCVTDTDLQNMNGQVSCMIRTTTDQARFCADNDTGQCLSEKEITNINAWQRYTSTMAVGSDGKLCARIRSASTITTPVYVDACEFTEFKPAVVANITDTKSYTPTISGFGTATNINFTYSIVGDKLFIQGNFAAGTTTAAQARISLPEGLSVKTGFGTDIIAGHWARDNANANTTKSGNIISSAGNTYLQFTTDHFATSVNPLLPRNGDDIAVALEFISLEAYVPVNGLSSGVEAVVDSSFPASAIKWKTSGCSASTTSSSYVTMNNASCSFAGATKKIGAVMPATTSGDIALKVSNVPPGKYEVCWAGAAFSENVASNACAVSLLSGSTRIAEVTLQADSVSINYANSSCEIVEYTTHQPTVEWLLQVARISGSSNCGVSAGTGTGSQMDISMKQLSGTIAANLKGLPLGPYSPTVTPTSCSGWSTVSSKVIPYQMPDNSWRMKFNIIGNATLATRSACYISIAGITTAAFPQAISCSGNSANSYLTLMQADASSSVVSCEHASASTDAYRFSGDIELASKPTFVP